MMQANSIVAANERLNAQCWLMTLQWPGPADEAAPGQFVNIRLGAQNDPLFRRPFSIFRCVALPEGSGAFQIVYRVTGRGSNLMSQRRPGDVLDVIGPSGCGFRRNLHKKTHILLAGGIGAAGLFMLAEQLSTCKTDEKRNVYVLLGAKTKSELIAENDFRRLGGEVLAATEDGSCGFHGRVTDLLVDVIKRYTRPSECAVYACGPEPMYKGLYSICKEFEMPAQVSIERRMMCGIGACLACVCKVNKANIMKSRDLTSSHVQLVPEQDFGYALVCKDGPVFDIRELVFDG